jgi:hypothetical protein
VQNIVLLEVVGISWYNPLWYFRTGRVLVQRFKMNLTREWRGYRKPIAHVNPNVKICNDFICLSSDGLCKTSDEYMPRCFENCFGIRLEKGQPTSAWQDADGQPIWEPLTCRNCKAFGSYCKGIEGIDRETKK